jgi:polysaccharide pyruvyl transferase WcaK-like protein
MRTYNIFIPEWVPLQNKGEEAIVRGIADVLFPEGNCEIHLLGDVDRYEYVDGIHVYPMKWFVSRWLYREFGLGFSWEKTRDSFLSLLRNGIYHLWPGWVRRPCRELKQTAAEMRQLATGEQSSTEKSECLRRLLNCDYIVAGHDGALNERVCQLIDVMLDLGKRVGVFGVEYPLHFKSANILAIHRNTLRQSEFFYCRTESTYQVVKQHMPEISVTLAADPAFGMKSAEDDEVDALIEEAGLRDFFASPVIMCTSCEPAPIARFCFEHVRSMDAKLVAHRKLFANLLVHVAATTEANILFLPHALGPGKALDDRVIAQEILERSGLPPSRATIINSSCSARVLKGLIGRAEFLIAERIHSIIGSVGVVTPFLCLGSKTDRRITGIVQQMVGQTDSIYYLNHPDISTLSEKFDAVWSRRKETRSQLASVSLDLRGRLESAAMVIREKIAAQVDGKMIA